MSLDLAQELLKDEIDINQGRPHRSNRRKYVKPEEQRPKEVTEAIAKAPESRNATSVIRHGNPLIRQEKAQWISGQAPYSDTYMLTKLDSTLSRLDEIQRDIDRLRTGIGNEFSELEKYQSSVEKMNNNLTTQIDSLSDKNITKTTELVRGVELSMGRLATKKSSGRANILLGLGLTMSLVNTAGIVIIVLILLGIIR